VSEDRLSRLSNAETGRVGARIGIRSSARDSMKLAIEVIGWIGATLIVGAYALLSAGKLAGDSRTYHLMNIVGAIGFVVNSGWNGAYPSAALNVVWLGIGGYALLKPRRAQLKSGAPVH
jgi:hypothetical protein